MSRWFRFYDAALDDPKVQRLPDAAFRAWVNLLCVASRNEGKIPECWEDLSFALRKSVGKTREILQVLISAGLVDKIENGFEPHNWSVRQYKSDVSTDRVKRFRKRSETVTETPPEQIQNRTEQKVVEAAPANAVAPRPTIARGTRWPANQPVPQDWVDWAEERFGEMGRAPPDIPFEAEKFANFWASKSGRDATKVDWKKTFLNWCLNAKPGQSRNKNDNFILGFGAAVAARNGTE